MNELPRQKLCEIITQYGRSLCDDPRRTEALLRDFCGEHRREIFVMVSALKERVAADLLASQDGVPQEVLLARLAKRLRDNMGITEDAARWAVESWALALGMVSPKELSRSEKVVQSPISTPSDKSINDFPLKPYTLSIGHVATTLNEIPTVCDADWNRAVDHFVKGHIIGWLRYNITKLRAVHQHGPADDLEEVVAQAEDFFQRSKSGGGFTCNVSLEKFLEELGADPPAISITPGEIILPTAGAGETVQPVELVISNRKRGYLYGTITSRKPWLEVIPKRFGCAEGDRCVIRVIPDLGNLSPGRNRFANGLSIHSNGGNLELPVHVDIEPPELHVDSYVLKFGILGMEETAQATFVLRNIGRGYLSGTVSCQVPWLGVETSEFRIHAGDSTSVTVIADSRTLQLGNVLQDQALMIKSNGGQASLGAKMQIRPPRLEVDTKQIRVLLNKKGKGEGFITVTNGGHGALEVEIGSFSGFQKTQLEILPQKVLCKAGQSKRFSVNVHMPNLQSGERPFEKGKIALRSNGGDEQVTVIVGAKKGPWLLVTSEKIDFGIIDKEPLPTEFLHIENIGNETLEGHIELKTILGDRRLDESWIHIQESRFQLSPKDSKDIALCPIHDYPVKLRLPMLSRPLGAVIQITSNDGNVEVPVKALSKYHG